MNNLKPIASTAHVTLDLPPSCVQFCPSDDRFFVVGTYNLEKDSAQTRSVAVDRNSHEEEDLTFSAPQSRNGSLLLFLIDGSSL